MSSSPRPKKGETGEEQSQESRIIFSDTKETSHKGFVLLDPTELSAYDCDFLRRVLVNDRRLYPKIWGQRTGCCITTTYRFSPRNFSPKATRLYPPTYTPDLARIKSAHYEIKGWKKYIRKRVQTDDSGIWFRVKQTKCEVSCIEWRTSLIGFFWIPFQEKSEILERKLQKAAKTT
jgi:hypothetical protein